MLWAVLTVPNPTTTPHEPERQKFVDVLSLRQNVDDETKYLDRLRLWDPCTGFRLAFAVKNLTTVDNYSNGINELQASSIGVLIALMNGMTTPPTPERRFLMTYTKERDQFIASMSTEGLRLDVARKLLAGSTTLNRLAELSCSSEQADRDRVACPGEKHADRCICDDYPVGTHAAGKHQRIPRIDVQAANLERRLRAAMPDGWTITTQGDPRGYVLRVIPPSYKERNANRPDYDLDAIGVPSGPSGLRF